jgi:hypothetical protein
LVGILVELPRKKIVPEDFVWNFDVFSWAGKPDKVCLVGVLET